MELSSGAMGILVTKLEKLLNDEYNLKKRLKKKIKNLKAELEIMEAELAAVSHTPQDQLSTNAKLWASELRVLSYDINNGLDPYMVHVDGIKRFIKKTHKRITKFKVLHEAKKDTNDDEIQGQTAPKKHSSLSDMYHKVSGGIDKLIVKLSDGDAAGSEEGGEEDDEDDDEEEEEEEEEEDDDE